MRKTIVYFVIFQLLCLVAGQYKAGFIEVNKDYGAYLYYYFAESQHNPTTDPVVLWLQGGPGCSSLFGAFVENGPQLINKDGSLSNNPWSWNTNASVLYIDSPVGTGYSYVENPDGYVTNEKTLALELYTALATFFFDLNLQYSQLPFYIFGESYAGKYLPWLASTILEKNLNATRIINLKGVGVGDGWVSPYYQTGSFAPYLYENGLINELEVGVAAGIYASYQGLIDIGSYDTAAEVGNALLSLLVLEAGDVDVYDIRTTSDPTDPLQDALGVYLNTPSVQKLMNASGQSWTACSSTPLFYLFDDEARSSEFLFADILEKVPVLLYNGNYDLICNMNGTSTWAANLVWPFQQAFNSAPTQSWTTLAGKAGYYKSASTLTHLIIYNAGHMSPFNQPQNCHDMLYRFIDGGFKP